MGINTYGNGYLPVKPIAHISCSLNIGGVLMKKKDHHRGIQRQGETNKDELSQSELQSGVNTVAEQSAPHAPLETADGKNNGALPAAYRGQRTNRT